MKNRETETETETVEEIKVNMAKASQEASLEADKAKELIKVVQDIEPTKSEPEVTRESLSSRLKKAFEGLNDTDREAWRQGWRPQEFFAGKKRDGTTKEWIDAESFLGKTKDVLPIANERIKDLTKQIEEARLQAAKTEERVSRAEEKGYNRALKEIQTKQLEAVELGDTEAYKALKTQEMELINDKYVPIVEVKEKITPPQMVQQPRVTRTHEEDRAIKEWFADNIWFHKPEHRPIANYAIAMDSKLEVDKPYLSVKERLEIVSHDLANNPSFAAVVNPDTSNKYNLGDSSSNASVFGNTPQAKGYNDLKAEDKTSCEKLIRLRGYSPDKIKTFRTDYAKLVHENNNN